jgi:hypothetical protein
MESPMGFLGSIHLPAFWIRVAKWKPSKDGILIKEKHFFFVLFEVFKNFQIFILITFSFNTVNHIAKKIYHFC